MASFLPTAATYVEKPRKSTMASINETLGLADALAQSPAVALGAQALGTAYDFGKEHLTGMSKLSEAKSKWQKGKDDAIAEEARSRSAGMERAPRSGVQEIEGTELGKKLATSYVSDEAALEERIAVPGQHKLGRTLQSMMTSAKQLREEAAAADEEAKLTPSAANKARALREQADKLEAEAMTEGAYAAPSGERMPRTMPDTRTPYTVGGEAYAAAPDTRIPRIASDVTKKAAELRAQAEDLETTGTEIERGAAIGKARALREQADKLDAHAEKLRTEGDKELQRGVALRKLSTDLQGKAPSYFTPVLDSSKRGADKIDRQPDLLAPVNPLDALKAPPRFRMSTVQAGLADMKPGAATPAPTPASADTVDKLRVQYIAAQRAGDTKLQKSIEDKMKVMMSAPGKTEYTKEMLGESTAVSPALLALAEQGRGRAEVLRGNIDTDRAELEDKLSKARGVTADMQKQVDDRVVSERSKVDAENKKFLDETAKYVVDDVEIVFDEKTGEPIDYRRPTKPTAALIAQLARRADTPEKQARVYEVASRFDIPYRSAAERFDPKREMAFQKDVESLFPSVRKSPVELALGELLQAGKLAGMGISAGQKQEGLVLKEEKLGVDQTKLQLALDQAGIKNAKDMDRLKASELMALAQLGSVEARSRLDRMQRAYDAEQNRREREAEREGRKEEKKVEKTERTTEGKLRDVNKKLEEAEGAEDEVKSINDNLIKKPTPQQIESAHATPGDKASSAILQRHEDYRKQQERLSLAEAKAKKAADLRKKKAELEGKEAGGTPAPAGADDDAKLLRGGK